MKQLAIKGHLTRSSEVINILEMLGGINKWEYLGDRQLCVYYINCDGIINYTSNIKGYNLKIFTLDEFIEKYPYKVGDKVITLAKCKYNVSEMRWNSQEIVYALSDGNSNCCWFSVEELQPYKEHDVSIGNYYCIAENNRAIIDNTNNDILSTPKIIFNDCEYDKVELDFGDNFQLEYGDKKYYAARKKPKYPKTYEECCKIIDYHLEGTTIIGYEKSLLENFQQLLICRDAYWKIADWKPNWEDNSDKYCIGIFKHLDTEKTRYRQYLLSFPTREMRDTFYENFKELIEGCKELL